MKKYWSNILALIVVFLLVLSYFIALLYGPRLDTNEIQKQNLWLIEVKVFGHLGFNLNKDSFYYMEAAKKPTKLLEHENYLQSRPLLPLVAGVLTKFIDNYIFSGKYIDKSEDFVGYYFSPYIAYIFINIVLIFIGFFLYLIILSRHCSCCNGVLDVMRLSRLPFVIGILFFFNDITKAFFFSPHTQMLNILVPVLTLFFALEVYFLPTIKTRHVLILSFMIGIGALAYGSFAVCEMIVVLSFTLKEIKKKYRSILSLIIRVGVCLSAFVVPLIVWYIFVKFVSGDFYNREVDRWHQFIWILDVHDKGSKWLFLTLLNNLFFFAKAMFHYPVTLLVLSPILMVLIYAIVFGKNIVIDSYEVISWCFVILLLFLIFFALGGYLVERLAFPATMMLIIIIGIMSCHIEKTILSYNGRIILNALCWVLVVCSGILTVLKDGPYY